MRKILGAGVLLVSLAGHAAEITVDEFVADARQKTDPFFRNGANAVAMTIREEVYKKTPQGDLFTRIYAPAQRVPGEKAPCAVFFYGGGWRDGSLLQFGKHCEYLVSKGFVAMTPLYRVEKKHGTTPREALEDALSCIRWVRTHADELGVDPDRLVVGGGSAGGQLAAAAATTTKIVSKDDDLSVSCRPDLLVLFNPAVNIGPQTAGKNFDRFAGYWQDFSPVHNLKPDMPPTVIFQGLEDTAVPVWSVQEFADKVQAEGTVCDLYLYPGQQHGFFNSGDCFYDTMARMGQFLETQGYIPAVD